MKLFLASFLLLAVAAVSTLAQNKPPVTVSKAPANSTTATPTQGPVTPKPLVTCPSETELKHVGCQCYPDSQYLICDGSSDYLKFEKRYALKTLVIRNSPKLPFWSERLNRSDDLTVESLIVLQSNADVEVADNFNDLLRLPSQNIKIETDGHIKTLDLAYMRSDLKSVFVKGVPRLVHGALTSFNLGEESRLEELRLHNVSFEPVLENLVLNKLPLKVVQIIDSNLKGVVSFQPTACPPADERIVVDLRGNHDLTGFDLASLFKTDELKGCHYHIDLSDNPNLDSKILVNNNETLTNHGANMFIRVARRELECDCNLAKLYKTLKNNIHSVECKGVGFLADALTDNTKYEKLCPKKTL